jgi:hypothetical protein
MSPKARRTLARQAAMHRWIRARFGTPNFAALGLPGGEIIDAGLAALAAGEETVESLVVSLAAPCLRREGVPLPHDVWGTPMCVSTACSNERAAIWLMPGILPICARPRPSLMRALLPA